MTEKELNLLRALAEIVERDIFLLTNKGCDKFLELTARAEELNIIW